MYQRVMMFNSAMNRALKMKRTGQVRTSLEKLIATRRRVYTETKVNRI